MVHSTPSPWLGQLCHCSVECFGTMFAVSTAVGVLCAAAGLVLLALLVLLLAEVHAAVPARSATPSTAPPARRPIRMPPIMPHPRPVPRPHRGYGRFHDHGYE